jgi:hypothetical protein
MQLQLLYTRASSFFLFFSLPIVLHALSVSLFFSISFFFSILTDSLDHELIHIAVVLNCSTKDA